MTSIDSQFIEIAILANHFLRGLLSSVILSCSTIYAIRRLADVGFRFAVRPHQTSLPYLLTTALFQAHCYFSALTLSLPVPICNVY